MFAEVMSIDLAEIYIKNWEKHKEHSELYSVSN